MPNKDGTGPNGEGPKTGRQLGTCESAQPIGKGFSQCGRGMGRGFRGRCFTQSQPVEFSKEQKAKILEAEKAELEAELKAVEKELKETKR